MAVSRSAPRGRVVIEAFESRLLRGNRPGDPAVRETAVYLPPGYDAGRTRRYPVLVMLTGFTGRGVMMLNRTGFGESLDRRLDRLIAGGKMPPLIVVMPDCFTRYGGSQYLNSTATGRYEDHVIREIVPRVDRTFRTKAEPAHRAVAGKSSGGYGALVLGMRHPEVFGALASHSGDAAFEYCYLPDIPKTLDMLHRHGGLTGFLRAFDRAPRKTRELLTAMNIVAMASCYSPNARAEHGFDLPFDPATGRMREPVWKRWLALDPVRMAPAHMKALRRLRLVFIDCGSRDEFNLHHGARMLAADMKRGGVHVLHEEFPDGHMDIGYRYDVSLPKLARALS